MCASDLVLFSFVVCHFSFLIFSFFFFNDTATTEIYTLSLHDALPISRPAAHLRPAGCWTACRLRPRDRKSTRLNSSHVSISYAVFCLKKKKTPNNCYYLEIKNIPKRRARGTVMQ